MARSVADCEPLLAAMAGVAPPPERPARCGASRSRRGSASSIRTSPTASTPRSASLDVVAVPPPDVELDLGLAFLDLVCTEMLVWHRRFDDRRGEYRPSIRGFLEYGENRRLPAVEYVALQERRAEDAARWLDWFAEHEIDALVEPTLPIVARPRGAGYDAPFTDGAEISLTHYWNWVGFPVVALPSGTGAAAAFRRASRSSARRTPNGISSPRAPRSKRASVLERPNLRRVPFVKTVVWDLHAAGGVLQTGLGTRAT